MPKVEVVLGALFTLEQTLKSNKKKTCVEHTYSQHT